MRWTALPALCLSALLAACGGEQQPSADAASPGIEPASNGAPQGGDWLVLHLLSDPENLNPITSSDASASAVLRWMFPGLLTLDNETLEQRPVIARALPEISEDRLTYTFRLREDVTFGDGVPVVAEDFVFTIKVVKNPEVLAPHYRNYLMSVRDVVAVDAHTLRFDLGERYFRNDLVLGGIAPLPRHHYDPEKLLEGISVPELDAFEDLGPEKKARVRRFAERFNADFQRNPLGAGAFVLRDPETDVITGERIVLRRREDFWAPDDPVLGDAWVNRIVFRVVNDPEAALVSFKGGDLDRFGLTPLQHRRRDTNTERFLRRADKKEHVSAGYTYIGWNQKNALFRDVRVRRALGHFVDKQAIVDTVLLGLGVPVESPIFIERSEYNHELPAYEFNPEKGKALLAQAGWEDTDGDGVLDQQADGERVKLEFEIISNSGNAIRKAVGLTVIDEMKRAGIGASFREIDWSIMLNKVKTFDYDAVILGWAMSVTPPDSYQIWHSSQAVPGGSNHTFYRNQEVDRLLEAYRVEFDPDERKTLYDRFQEILYDEQPYTFLFMQRAVSSWDRRFQGVSWYPSGGTDMAEWWVPAVQQRYAQ